MDTQRLILLFIFGFSVLMLWEAWQKENQPVLPAAVQQGAREEGVPGPAAEKPEPAAKQAPAAASAPAAAASGHGETLHVRTDLVIADIDTVGGTLKRLELLKHKASADADKDFVLIGPEHSYEAQSGLTGEAGPNHRTIWHADAKDYVLAPGQELLQVRLTASANGLTVQKTYTFKRNSYVVDVAMDIRNDGAQPVSPFAYFQFTHDGKPDPDANKLAQSFGARSFVGFAIYTAEKAFHKIPPADIDKGKVESPIKADNGWLALVQHYFVSAWLIPDKTQREYVFEKRQDGLYVGRAVVPVPSIAPGSSRKVSIELYSGPQEQQRLKAAAPGLDLVVDYGWLTIIARPLFWLLQEYHRLTGNWGFAIILLTVTIKLLFFPLSAASYKSMAKMKLVTPRLTKIRETYGHDRQKMNQAMMELYKTEKINPLGGCFPILVQIPVFIALYWTLLASIELRHAPFILWIKDLSALDPYYVLPILMTLTMVLQTRMNPTPPDPVQAKVMQFMPFVFSIFFFFFPAGLVLYWLVNNILSILQQWQIQRMFNRDKPAHGKR